VEFYSLLYAFGSQQVARGEISMNKMKAILYPLIGAAHLVFWQSFHTSVLPIVIGFMLIGLGILYICRWVKEKSQ